MNWIDFNILCIGEKKPKICKSEVFSTEIMNKNHNSSRKCYVENWDILNHIQGIRYALWTKEEKFDFIVNSTWETERENGGGYQLFVEKENINIFFDILHFYIFHSPVRKIIVLFRHQGEERERISETPELNVFLEKLSSGEIYGNMAYCVTETG